LLLRRNGKPVPDGQYLYTIDIPHWIGTGPYPSVKVRMDFRGMIHMRLCLSLPYTCPRRLRPDGDHSGSAFLADSQSIRSSPSGSGRQSASGHGDAEGWLSQRSGVLTWPSRGSKMIRFRLLTSS
jgi:hypothetical protein